MVLVRVTGTSTSAKSGFPVGTAIDMTSVDVLKCKDGKVTEHWGYLDPIMASSMPAPVLQKKTGSTMHK